VSSSSARPPLTRRQRQILDFLEAYQAEHDLSPTLEEIAQQFGVNKVTIFGHVAELERKGVIERAQRGVSRALRVLPEPVPQAPRSHSSVPIAGTIAAGRPIEAVEDDERLDLGEWLPKDREVYALRVRGQSMIDDAIRDGDIVLVERRQEARNGETVVAILEGEQATLKRYYREDGRVRLQPANASMDPIYVHGPLDIRGVVIGVVRRFP
jgi:repressor LexA